MKKNNYFLSNIYAVLIVGLIFSISLAINSIFIDIRTSYINSAGPYRFIIDIIYFFVLFLLLLLCIYFYSGSFNISQIILNH